MYDFLDSREILMREFVEVEESLEILDAMEIGIELSQYMSEEAEVGEE